MSIKALETALDDRLRDDATLSAALGQGLWNSQVPLIASWTGDLTWAIYRCQGGGDRNNAPGRWKDVLFLIQGYSAPSEGALVAAQIDSRIEELLHGWTPTITGYEEVWPAQRERSVHASKSTKSFVTWYAVGALYRFRFGTQTEPTPPTEPDIGTVSAASGDQPFLKAVYERLQKDSTLIDIAQGGIWFGEIPNFEDVFVIELNEDEEPVYTDTALDSPTWVEFLVDDGGPTNDATGNMFRDLEMFIRARSFEHPGQAIDADDRIDALLHNWQFDIDGYGETWKVLRTEDRRRGARFPKPVDRKYWEASGVYRFRVEKAG